jgi:hypothetical protein
MLDEFLKPDASSVLSADEETPGAQLRHPTFGRADVIDRNPPSVPNGTVEVDQADFRVDAAADDPFSIRACGEELAELVGRDRFGRFVGIDRLDAGRTLRPWSALLTQWARMSRR